MKKLIPVALCLCLAAASAAGCSNTADCRSNTVLVKVQCASMFQGATVAVQLTEPGGKKTEVLTLGPCPAAQNAEFALSDYESLTTVSLTAELIRDSQVLSKMVKADVNVGPTCEVIDINFDSEASDASAKADSDTANDPDAGAPSPPSCTDGAEGCACIAGGTCSGDLVCTTDVCRKRSCGNAQMEAGEECDDGNQSNTDSCRNDCKAAVCGDKFVHTGVELCDDGNAVNTDTCTMACKPPTCGDGFMQDKEECDDGNSVDADACTTACKLPKCGDGFVQAGEGCDDGPNFKVELDACAPDCSWRYEKKYIYPSSTFFGGGSGGFYKGNLGGPAGADAICQGLATNARLLSTYKALIVGGNRRAALTPFNSDQAQDWVIRKYTFYYNWKKELAWRTDNTRLLGVRNGAQQNLLAEITDGYPWGGWVDGWVTQPDATSNGTCKGWTSSSESDWGTFPLPSLLKGAGEPCSYQMPILCVEQ